MAIAGAAVVLGHDRNERERERESGEVEASIKMKPAITTGTNIGIIVYLDNAFGYKNISLSMS